MIDIQKLRNKENKVIALGSYPDILQSVLDFDFLSKKEKPSIVGIIANGRKFERYFWNSEEILIPVYERVEDLPNSKKEETNLFLNFNSGRRSLSSSESSFDNLSNLMGGTIFAENVPEINALELFNKVNKENKFVIGPASVGLLIPGSLKLGAIGGTQYQQVVNAHLLVPGNVAVFSASGGMTNEILNIVTGHGKRISFSLSFGGDRFPILRPKDAFLAAENDPQTEYIVYFGELGGTDEYEIAELLKNGGVTKPVIAYIAGNISEMFETPPQFGHAKAMAKTGKESAAAKREALKNAGAKTAESFSNFIELIKKIPIKKDIIKSVKLEKDMDKRKHALFVNTVSEEKDGSVEILGEDLDKLAKTNSFAYIVSSLLLGKKIKSRQLEEFVDFILKILVDHGPNVSGAVNTMIAARAGKDLVSSLTSGLLTIGPRFGGAINDAAKNWLDGVATNTDPHTFVENFAKRGEYISGIGHRKYKVDNPDPRVQGILNFINLLKTRKYTKFARSVEKITTSKKGNLILNVDGAIAAVMLDILSEKENLAEKELKELINIEFFNALFVLSRAVGFTAHYLDQRRIDEGLFRLPKEEVSKPQKV